MPPERMSVSDTVFLMLDRPTNPMNIGAVVILEGAPLRDPSGRLRIDDLRAASRSILPERPRNRRHPLRVPFGLGRPVWVDATAFDVDDHVDVVTLADPSREGLFRHAADHLMTPFAPDRPLWSYRFVDGLPGGEVAVIARTHHAHRDGGSGVENFAALVTLTPEVPEFPPPAAWTPEPRPSRWSLVRDALAHQVRHAVGLGRFAARAVRRPRRAWARGRRMAGAVGPFVGSRHPVPRLSFNQPPGTARRLAAIGLSLDDCRSVRAAFGGTVNDVLVAAVAGGVRRLLDARGECGPGAAVTVMCPVSHREAGDASAGNQATGMTVTVGLDESDPIARLRQVCAGTGRAKDSAQAADLAVVVGLTDFVVPVMLRGAVRRIRAQEGFNLGVSNLAGPPVPVWLLGARVREIHPFGTIMGNTGMSVTALSYDGTVFVGVNADVGALPDLDVFTAGVEAELADLVARAASVRPA